MGAFKCPCGKMIGLYEVKHWIPTKKDGFSRVVCSEECKKKYSGV